MKWNCNTRHSKCLYSHHIVCPKRTHIGDHGFVVLSLSHSHREHTHTHIYIWCKIMFWVKHFVEIAQLTQLGILIRIFVLWFNNTLISFRLGNLDLNDHIILHPSFYSKPISIFGYLKSSNVSVLPPIDTSPIDDGLAFSLLLLLLQLTTYLQHLPIFNGDLNCVSPSFCVFCKICFMSKKHITQLLYECREQQKGPLGDSF